MINSNNEESIDEYISRRVDEIQKLGFQEDRNVRENATRILKSVLYSTYYKGAEMAMKEFILR